MNMKQKIEQGREYLLGTYSQVPVVFSSGEGCTLTDTEGKEYLDFVGGIAVNALGYGDKGLTKALNGVLDSGLLHCSNLYYNNQAIEAAKAICTLAGMDKVFFCNSGAEANEAALKLSRKFGHRSSPARTRVITMVDSFHGRTYGSVAATGQAKYHQNFDPLPQGFQYALFNDLGSVEALISEHTCAILVEPIQGEGGVVPATKAFLQGLRELCDKHDLLLIYDEVQCGMGRSGKPFAWQLYEVKPDVITLAKALAGGVPCGAMLTSERASDIFSPGDHASTFGGNALAMAGVCEMTHRLSETGLCNEVSEKGAYLRSKLGQLVTKYPDTCKAVRGFGLMNGMVLSTPPREVVEACFAKGLLVLSAGSDVLRFVPPLVISKDEIDVAVTIVDEVLATLN
ncbi:MAG TPA: aspartate aminotransferase family protein [Spirochaetales bacterium]|nr:aspartate aminotransferase family protein [Spirochaetales bacterium]